MVDGVVGTVTAGVTAALRGEDLSAAVSGGPLGPYVEGEARFLEDR